MVGVCLGLVVGDPLFSQCGCVIGTQTCLVCGDCRKVVHRHIGHQILTNGVAIRGPLFSGVFNSFFIQNARS